MSEETQLAAADLAYTIRVLSGVLYGAEFTVAAGQTLLVVGNEETVTAASFPAEAIFLPGSDGSPNIQLELPQTPQEDAEQFGVTLLYRDNIEARDAHLQQVVSAGELRFAVKLAEHAWASHITTPSIEQPLSAQPTPLPPPTPPKRWRGVLFGLCGALLVAGSGWAVVQWMQPTAEAQVLSLQQVLAGSTHPYQIYHGLRGELYVFAATEQDAAWARQALVHQPQDEAVHVLTRDSELLRLAPLLDQQEVAWFNLRLDNPLKPVLLLSQERAGLDAAHRSQLQRWLTSQLPYAKTIVLEMHSDSEVAASARSGLDRLALTYTTVLHRNSVAFRLSGDLDDGTLAHLQSFTQHFYQQWGKRYVYFAVELKDNWLKGKSFQSGSDGYVKLAPTQWYFPTPVKFY